ncbi:muscarinic acetylcholine receptor m3 [Plakobranchus ocellatus]|uniref:Muscarinic acetylcholine receptor m3 n=1 Tax=Plakobranchus ocellatus TaxID=259542 RepID=A0AAV4CMF6_9GAST|nr:muscarinic acetylcholine receptor m3 [Plakobranchus ocellatus]
MASPLPGEAITPTYWVNSSAAGTSAGPGKTLYDVNLEKAHTLLPACIFLACLAVFGLVGNSLVCYVFGARLKPGTQNSLIVCLAVFDLLSCALGIPNEIADMQFYFTYSSEAACKIMRFINMFTSLGSIFTLLFIAIDRYRKVCLPFKFQLHMRHMKRFVVPVIMGGALFFAWPSLLVYGLRSAETGVPGLTGRDCSASEVLRGTLVPLLYNSILFGGFFIIVVALACLYFRVLRGVRRLNRNKGPRRCRPGAVACSCSDSGLAFSSTSRRTQDPAAARESFEMREEIKTNEVVEERTTTTAIIEHERKSSSSKVHEKPRFGEVPCVSLEEKLDENRKCPDVYVSFCPTPPSQRSNTADPKGFSVARVSRSQTYQRPRLKRQLSFPLATSPGMLGIVNTRSLCLHKNGRPNGLKKTLGKKLCSNNNISDSCPVLCSNNSEYTLFSEQIHGQNGGEKAQRNRPTSLSFTGKVCNDEEGQIGVVNEKKRKKKTSSKVNENFSPSFDSREGVVLRDLRYKSTIHTNYVPSSEITEEADEDLKEIRSDMTHLLSLRASIHEVRRGSNLFPSFETHLEAAPENIHQKELKNKSLPSRSSFKQGKTLRFSIDNTSSDTDCPSFKPRVHNSNQVLVREHESTNMNIKNTRSGTSIQRVTSINICKVSNSIQYGTIGSESDHALNENSSLTERQKPIFSQRQTRAFRSLNLNGRNNRWSFKHPSSTTHEKSATSSSLASAMTSTTTMESHMTRLSPSSPDEDKSPHQTSSTSSCTSNANSFSRNRHNDSRKLRSNGHRMPRSRSTTIALLVTLVFVASFLPHLCLQAAQLASDGFAANLTGPASLAYNAFLRSYFINSAANPVLYGILNLKFSAEVKSLLRGGTGDIIR